MKFRATGISAEVFREMGMSVVSVAPAEIVPALERGVVDAAEFSDPSADMAIGLHHVRKFYHMPGIHQPTGIMEVQINKAKWEALPADVKSIVKHAAMAEALPRSWSRRRRGPSAWCPIAAAAIPLTSSPRTTTGRAPTRTRSSSRDPAAGGHRGPPRQRPARRRRRGP
jgi:TRAP-type mannitol/chloroaromatic compound transport system substrate-binding protein